MTVSVSVPVTVSLAVSAPVPVCLFNALVLAFGQARRVKPLDLSSPCGVG